MLSELIFLVVFLIGFLYYNTPKRLAPGPISWPFLGHLPYFVADQKYGIQSVLSKWAKHYGPILGVNFGSYQTIVLNDYKLIREAWNIPELCARPRLPVTLVRGGEDLKPRGLIFSDGENWTQQRRFAVRNLKDFGFGKSSMEGIILEEAVELIDRFRKDVGHPVSTEARFQVAIINALWRIVAGERFTHDDPKLIKLVKCVTQNLTDTGAAGIIVFMPNLVKRFPNVFGWTSYLESFHITHNFIGNFIDQKMKNFMDNTINDFSDLYIQEIKNNEDVTSSFYGEEGVKFLNATLDDLFSAGGETTSTTLSWLLLCLAMNQEAQERMYQEIQEVVGKSRLPSLGDRVAMPFTESVILETLRISSVVATAVYHRASEDVHFHGRHIPKDTILFSNLYAVLHDPFNWDEPEKFKPERFLAQDGRTIVRPDAFIPFSCGKRVCPGEALAKNEIFLIGTCLIQNFIVIVDPLGPIPTLRQKVNGVVSVPHPHNLIFAER